MHIGPALLPASVTQANLILNFCPIPKTFLHMPATPTLSLTAPNLLHPINHSKRVRKVAAAAQTDIVCAASLRVIPSVNGSTLILLPCHMNSAGNSRAITCSALCFLFLLYFPLCWFKMYHVCYINILMLKALKVNTVELSYEKSAIPSGTLVVSFLLLILGGENVAICTDHQTRLKMPKIKVVRMLSNPSSVPEM